MERTLIYLGVLLARLGLIALLQRCQDHHERQNPEIPGQVPYPAKFSTIQLTDAPSCNSSYCLSSSRPQDPGKHRRNALGKRVPVR
jgi:hypothetical protein